MGLAGIATWNYGDGTLAERIERFAAMGYNAVSLSRTDSRALAAGETPEVEQAIVRHSLAVAVHAAFWTGDGEIDVGQLVGYVESLVRWHSMTGRLVTLNFDAAGTKEDTGPRQKADGMIEPLARMLDVAGPAGITVGVEDWPLNSDELGHAGDLVGRPGFGILIDLGHMNLRLRRKGDTGGPFPMAAAEEYIEAIELPVNELHVHNNDGAEDRHAPPTMGNADLAAVARMLRHRAAVCVSTIEIVPRWCGLTAEQGWDAAREALGYWRDAFADGR